jgi:acyl-CoA hydrolase
VNTGDRNVRQPQYIGTNSLAQLINPGQTVYLPGSSGAPTQFIEELLKEPQASQDLRVLTSFVPGINALAMERLHETAQVTGLFMQSSLARAQRERRYRALPMSYAGFVNFVRSHVEVDLTVVQVSPPDRDGQCSLGPAVEFTPVVWSKSRRRMGLINRNTPSVPGSVQIPYSTFDYVCETDTTLPTYATKVDAVTEVISRSIATLIDDGAVLQLGLGGIPTALASALIDRRQLRLHSGMLSDGLFTLSDAGALDMDFVHTTCVLLGSQEFYCRVGEFAPLRVIGCEVTHDATVLSGYGRFTAVNSAVEVDLFGQCNLEHIGGAAISGMGGAPDFARAARLSIGGRSIVALKARHQSESRIVCELKSPGVVSLARCDVDYVITEFGIAMLTGASVHERAAALIAIAAPEFQDTLTSEWRAIAARL